MAADTDSATTRARPAKRRITWAVPPLRAVALVVVGAVLGALLVAVAGSGDEGPATVSAEGPASTPTTSVASSEATPTESTASEETTVSLAEEPQPEPEPPPTDPRPPDGDRPDPVAVAAAIGPIGTPSDCGLPLDHPESMPGAARDYRGGTHEGIDFICSQRGRTATVPLAGRVLLVERTYEDPPPGDRLEVLAVARELGRTPPWILAMLFGRFVVIDHGNIPGAGNVVTIYAHLEEVDPQMQPGLRVEAGTRVGEIGNRGTESAGTGEARPQAIHLHWEIHVDDEYLGAGADFATVQEAYRTLFGA